MKKITKKLMLVIVMAALCFAVAVTANAERAIVDSGECGAQGDNVIWTLYDDGEMVVSGEGKMADYEEKLDENNYPSTTAPWSEYRLNIETVSINEGVTNIGAYAFSYCYNLEIVDFSCTVTDINDGAFSDCFNLKSANIPSGVTHIGSKAFYYCLRLQSVILPVCITTIENLTFAGCASLSDIVIPDNITEIERRAFLNCVNVTDIIISDGIKKIDIVSLASMPFLEKVIVKSMDVELGEMLWICEAKIVDISREEFVDMHIRLEEQYENPYLDVDEELADKFDQHIVGTDLMYIGTMHCHAGSTAEAYAIENNMEYVTMHFFEGEWAYDYENMVRFRKCIHCDELETEQLEVTEIGDVEIINPADPDTDFTVDEIVKGGDNYVIIENTLGGNITGDWEVVKAFDITLKNHDGVHVQPDGTVKVKLPLDWSKDGVYKVYRVNDDGTLTDMNAYRQGSHMVFETDHFSIYVIVDESEKADIPEDAPTEAPTEKLDFIQKLLNFFTSLLEFFRSLFGI